MCASNYILLDRVYFKVTLVDLTIKKFIKKKGACLKKREGQIKKSQYGRTLPSTAISRSSHDNSVPVNIQWTYFFLLCLSFNLE